MPSDAQKRAAAKYHREKMKQLGVRFSPNEMELFDYVKSQPNTAGFVKQLLREDMMSRTHYSFESANKGTVEVSVTGEYDGACKDIEVCYAADTPEGHIGNDASFEETDDAEDVIGWLVSEGVEFESRRSMAFSRDYIQHVMIERDMTERELLDEAASWTDEQIDVKLYMFD